MKGLFTASLGRKEEGYELVRMALKKNVKSHISWHVYGLLCRTDKNYEEALKCFINASRFDKENIQILRDIATLQLQLQQFIPHCDTRYQIISLRPVIRANWISLAMAYYFDKRASLALKVLDAMLEGFSPDRDSGLISAKDLEDAILLKIYILEKMGHIEQALRILEENGTILPNYEYNERKAVLSLKSKVNGVPREFYQNLWNYNPESRLFLSCLLQKETNSTHYGTMKHLQKGPHSLLLIEQILLLSPDFNSFVCDFEELIVPALQKGRWSYLKFLKPLYQTERHLWLEKIIKQRLHSENGISELWVSLLALQHHTLNESYAAALQIIDDIVDRIEQVGASSDLIVIFAWVLKRAGLYEHAARCIELASLKDVSDRFLNTKAVKYLLRSGDIEGAKQKMLLFLRKGNLTKPSQDLIEMQVIWYALELGKALQNSNQHIEALSYFQQITKHFSDFVDDQFDFHNYVLRRSTFGDYLDLYSWEADIFGDPVLAKTLVAAAKSVSILQRKCPTDPSVQSIKSDITAWMIKALKARSADFLLKKSALWFFSQVDEYHLASKLGYELNLITGDSIDAVNWCSDDGKYLGRFTQTLLSLPDTKISVEERQQWPLTKLDRFLETSLNSSI